MLTIPIFPDFRTSPRPSWLETRLYLVSGTVARFYTEEAEDLQFILEQVQRGRVFSQPSLIIADHRVVHAFPGSAVTRLDLLMDSIPISLKELDFIKDGAERREITPEQWQERVAYLEDKNHTRQQALGPEGNLATAYGLLETGCGMATYLEMRIWLPPPREQQRFLQNIFSYAGFPFQGLDGSISFVNPTQIVRAIFNPGAEPPNTAWKARPVQ